MTTATVLLLAAVFAVVYGVLLAHLIRNDGHVRLLGTDKPPRSHYRDQFDPRIYA